MKNDKSKSVLSHSQLSTINSQLPKGYKQTEVGVIPKDWEIISLGRVIENLLAGVSVNSGKKDIDCESSDYSILKTSSVLGGRFIKSECKPILPDDLGRARLNPKADTIIISRMNTPDLVGECGYVNSDDPHLFIPDRLWMTQKRQNSRLCIRWLNYLFSSVDCSKRIKGLATGTSGSMKNIAKSSFLGLSIPLPPTLAEQEAIASALSDADDSIESLERLIAKKRLIKQGAMQELLSGKRRLPGFEVKHGYKRTEVGKTPNDWMEKTLSDLAHIKSGESITSERINQFSTFPCYGGNGLRGYSTRYTHDGKFALIGRQGALCGNVTFVNGKFYASEHAVVVTAYPNTSIQWLSYALKARNLNQFSESSAQPGLSVIKLNYLLFAAPSTLAEQSAIAQVLSDMDTEIEALEGRLAKARKIKEGMMQELLTGRIRLI